MTIFISIIYLCLTAIIPYIISISPLISFTPQLIALSSLPLLIFIITKPKSFNLSQPRFFYSIAVIVNLIVFTTHGLNSPFFFLIYFLLFTLAFNNYPSVTLTYSLLLILCLSQSLNSTSSLLPLFSLIFISPLVWFVGHQYIENLKLHQQIAFDQTEALLWLNLKFKTGILHILDTVSQLLSNPSLNHSQKDQLHFVKDSAKSLLNSSKKLTNEIDEDSQD
jgi:hypothetical protein